ncbi:MAG: acyl-CoA dehydrogenase family protein [Actinobacteria bacterium]|nr:acyl-CoA dehydrogenase family protein [Actinomycetota bacterium]
MQIVTSPEDEAFLNELRAFLDANCPPEAKPNRDFLGEEDAGIPQWAREWQATLFDNGWMVPSFSPELGGRNATPSQTFVYLEELARQRVVRSVHFGGYAIVGPSLLEFGNDEQKAMAPGAIRGDTVWCVGMSEPDAGSDLAALKTRAVDDGDSFIVTGQKVWTSYAPVADKCFCYVRTDPDAPKHKGISVLIVDLDSPGIDIRPLVQITGSAEFAEVFFDDVVVPKANLVGDLNDGWRITMGSLAHERGGLWVEGVVGAQRALEGLCDLVKRNGLGGDPAVRRRLGGLYERVESLRALGYKGLSSFAQGSSAPEHSYMKLATSELRQELSEYGMDLQGAFGAAVADQASDEGRWWRGFFVSIAASIGGGTSEIQRNVVATRVLGLPRS